MNSLRRQPHRRTKPHWLLFIGLAGLGGWLEGAAARGGPLDHWTAPAAPPTSLRLYAVAAGPDAVVAVGEAGVAACSSDLSAWTAAEHGPTLFGVAYGNHMFFAAGEFGDGLASADGLSWSPRPSATSFANANAVAWGNGTFLIVGDHGLVATTPDGYFWNWLNTGTPEDLRAAAWAQGVFAAVGNFGTVLTSRDGILWTDRTPLVFENMLGVAHGDGTYVAVGDFGGALISRDARSWAILDTGTTDSLLAVAYGGGTFAAVGRLGNILTSPDGVQWTVRNSGTELDLRGIAYFNGRFVAVGDAGTILVSGELPLVTLASEESSVLESARDVPARLRFSRAGSTASDLTVNMSISGTALNGVDYDTIADAIVIPAGQSSATLAITPIEDNTPEDVETVVVTLLETGQYGIESHGSATVRIGEALVSVEAADPEAGEGGLDPGAFRVRRQGRTDGPLEVYYDTGGSATPGMDYEALGGAVTILEGAGDALIAVTPLDDDQSEGEETVTVTLRSGSRYLVSLPDKGKVALLDDEPPLVIDWDQWRWRHPRPPGVSFDKVVFGHGLFVALHRNGGIFTSPDGVDWTTQNPGLSLNMLDIAFGNGRFVISATENASSNQGVFLVSTDGRRWIPRRIVTGVGTLGQLFHVHDRFMGQSDLGVLLASADGVVWTQVQDQIEGSLRALAYGNGRYVAASYLGGPEIGLWTSLDGDHWSLATNIAGRYPNTVGFGNGQFLATGSAGLVLASFDGQTWEVTHDGPDVPDFTQLAWGAGRFAAIAYQSVWASSDGAAWTQGVMDENIYWVPATIAFGDGTFVVAGVAPLNRFDFGTSEAHVLTSADGETWVLRDQGAGYTLRSIACSGQRLVAVGDQVILSSSEGVDWIEAANDPSFYLRGVAHGGDLFVAVGNQILTSPDGIVWTERAGGKSLSGVAWGQDRFVAVGEFGSVETSPDGINWTPQDTPTGGSLRGVAWGNGLFVAVSASWPYEFLVSSDGVRWESQGQTESLPLLDITYAGGLFIAVGQTGGCCEFTPVFTSPDGTNWTARASGGQAQGVAGSNSGDYVAVGGYLIGGFHGFVFPLSYLSTSEGGLNWTPRPPPPMGLWLNDVAWAGSSFFAVGENGAILESRGVPPMTQPRLVPADIAFPASGGVRLRVQAPAGSVVILEASPDLQSWSFVDGAECLEDTLWIDDPDGAFQEKRFYRARLPAP